MNVSEALKSRVSSNHFDPAHEISEAEVAALVTLAVEAPSCYNIQHCRFVAVTDKAQKKALRAVSYNQAKVEEASVVFLVCGDLEAHKAFVERLRAAAAAGHVPAATVDYMTSAVSFFDDRARAREEAVRSAGLAGMALLLAAEEAGLASGPMIGFDPARVSSLLGLSERYFPALMIAVGRPLAGNGPRKPRMAAADVLRFNTGNF